MEFKDYYKILGIEPNADEKTIKQTYRKLARQYHPDVNPGNKEAADKFKEINEAYQVVSNPEERRKYDELRAQYQSYQQRGGRAQDFDFDRWRAQPGQGARVEYGTVEDMEDMYGPGGGFSDFFSNIFGGMPGRGPRGAPQGPRRGQDIEFEIEIPLSDAYRGASRMLQIDDRRIEARIPPGVNNGSRIRLAGQGEPGINNGQPGDLYLVVHLIPDPQFEREGDNLLVEVPVDIYTAALGGEVRVPTMDRPVLLKIPPQTQAGRTFRLRGKGMPKLNDPKTHGDLLAQVQLVLPEPMSEHELDTLRQLKKERQPA